MAEIQKPPASNFIRNIVLDDLKTNKWGGRVVTRFPPEPNGYPHIGHAKAISVDFGIAQEFGGVCHLRFDDTNPVKEEQEYVQAIQDDVRWLGYDWGEHLYFASDYFGQMYEYAMQLIEQGQAFVCELTADQIREYRGTLTAPGRESPWRNRPVAENRELFVRMKNGEFENGAKTLRAKIDMAAPNLNLRDPVMYRILKQPHHRAGAKWNIYPTYDWAHGLEDSIERVTHSLCSLEFEDHRPLYDWYLQQLGVYHPQQIEFARLNLSNTVMSKRKLRALVEERRVSGWDDPRMPTLRGLRRRGYTPESIRDFCERIGVSKAGSRVDISLLEHCLRDDLNRRAPRCFGVLRPLKLVIENYPPDCVEELTAANHPEDPAAGERKIPFTRELYIERDDFMEDPPKKFFRLAPGREVRLRYAYFITCTNVVKNERGEVVELRCVYDPATRGGDSPDGRKVKATLHWVSASHSLPAEVRLYDHLFLAEDPESAEGLEDWKDGINPASLESMHPCYVEPALGNFAHNTPVQFERLGYFCLDADSTDARLVFNRSVTLKDQWARIKGQTE